MNNVNFILISYFISKISEKRMPYINQCKVIIVNNAYLHILSIGGDSGKMKEKKPLPAS